MSSMQIVPPRHHQACRRGTTIIELIGMLGLLLVIGATTHRSLGNITRASRESRVSRASRMELDRLAATLRQDGHSAASIQAENGVIKFDFSQRQVRYQWEVGQPLILRQVFVDGDRKAVDRFRLRIGTKINTFVTKANEDAALLSVELSRGQNTDQSSRFLIEVGT